MSKKAKAAQAKPKRKIKKGPAKKMTGSAAQRNKDDKRCGTWGSRHTSS
jgi:hypothetical protein